VFLINRFEPGWFVDPSIRLPLRMVLPTGLLLAGAAIYLAFRSAETRGLPQRTGGLGLVGETGTTLDAISGEGGEVFVHGERWRALSPTPLPPGARVVVRRVEGLTLYVDEVKS
jgi:membrane-bound serine protease (ClpP class)